MDRKTGDISFVGSSHGSSILGLPEKQFTIPGQVKPDGTVGIKDCNDPSVKGFKDDMNNMNALLQQQKQMNDDRLAEIDPNSEEATKLKKQNEDIEQAKMGNIAGIENLNKMCGGRLGLAFGLSDECPLGTQDPDAQQVLGSGNEQASPTQDSSEPSGASNDSGQTSGSGQGSEGSQGSQESQGSQGSQGSSDANDNQSTGDAGGTNAGAANQDGSKGSGGSSSEGASGESAAPSSEATVVET